MSFRYSNRGVYGPEAERLRIYYVPAENNHSSSLSDQALELDGDMKSS